MRSLADLKRYLALPNAAMRMVSHEWYNATQGEWISKSPHNPNYRGVSILQSNAVAFEDDTTKSGKSWLYFPKASEIAFDSATNQITITERSTRLVYQWANVELVAN
jgi:hypothetical protein